MDSYEQLDREVGVLVREASARAQRLSSEIGRMARKHQQLLYQSMQTMMGEARRLHEEGQDASQARSAADKLKEMYDFVTDIVSQGDQVVMPQQTLADFFQRFPSQVGAYNQIDWNELRRWFDWTNGIAPQMIRMLDYFDQIPKQ